FFFSSRRRHTRLQGDWSSDVCSSDLPNDPTNWPAANLTRGSRGVRSSPRQSLAQPSRRSSLWQPPPFSAQHSLQLLTFRPASLRSEERRVGKEWWSGGSVVSARTSVA